MSNEITSTQEISDLEWDDGVEPRDAEPRDAETDMTATKNPEGGVEFFVQMRSYTKRDMEELIVEAAARVIVGNYGKDVIAKKVEERCIALVTEMVDKHLLGVTAAIVDQPLLPKYPFMKPEQKPVTMREFIGLSGREYLEAKVDGSGKPTSDAYYSKPRLQRIVEDLVSAKFKNDLEKASNACVAEIQKELRARYEKILNEEKDRFRSALAKVAS